jgi:hypothetical protein
MGKDGGDEEILGTEGRFLGLFSWRVKSQLLSSEGSFPSLNTVIIAIGFGFLMHLSSEAHTNISQRLRHLWGHYIEKTK